MRETAGASTAGRNRYQELLGGVGAPLVSVVIRSIGRAMLADALDSVSRQTYPNIEVVLVNAAGPAHPEPPASCGRFPVRFIDAGQPRRRSQAANAGLAAATGVVIFLDDDDWFDPCHIAGLVAALAGDPASRVAYAGVRTAGLEPEERVLDRAFSLPRLRFGNFIPLHAGLFHRSLVEEGCAFDEQLDQYEDWDFWLQLADRSPFTHVAQVSAVYRASGASGVGLIADPAITRKATARVYEKWRAAWARLSPADLFAGSEAELDTAQRHIRALEERLRRVEARAVEAEGSLLQQAGSWSWRITAPLRRMSHAMRRWRAASLEAAAPAAAGVAPEAARPAAGTYRPVPLVSVVMPVFNACGTRPEYLDEAVASVTAQTYPNLELIIVDDGSTDGTFEHCRALVERVDSLPVTLARQANGGQSSARNAGVRLARGEWVSFIDQDDAYFPDKLERVVPRLDDSIDVLYTDADTMDPNGSPLVVGIHRRLRCGWPHPKRSLEEILFGDIYVMPGVMTVRRTRLDEVGGFDETLSGYEDDDLFLRLFTPGRVRYLPESTLRWRMHDESASRTRRMVASRLRYWRKLLDGYTDGGRDRARSAAISRRFFREFVSQAIWQLKDGTAMWELNYATSKQILPRLPILDRVAFDLLRRPLLGLARRSPAVRRLVVRRRRPAVAPR